MTELCINLNYIYYYIINYVIISTLFSSGWMTDLVSNLSWWLWICQCNSVVYSWIYCRTLHLSADPQLCAANMRKLTQILLWTGFTSELGWQTLSVLRHRNMFVLLSSCDDRLLRFTACEKASDWVSKWGNVTAFMIDFVFPEASAVKLGVETKWQD